MNVHLIRREFRSDGIFGDLLTEDGDFICFVLEHAYADSIDKTKFDPKTPAGSYICQRGIHELHDLEPFEAFEIMNVPGHNGILFHIGNYNRDSEGCLLLGLGLGRTSIGGQMITSSKEAFKKFMDLQSGLDSFTIVIEDCP